MLKLTFLLILREIYLFFRNLLGLLFHPYKTLRAIRREEDFSQVFLLSSWPISTIIFVGILFVTIKLLLRPQGVLNQVINLFAICYLLFAICYSLYLVYWFLFYWKISRKMKNPAP